MIKNYSISISFHKYNFASITPKGEWAESQPSVSSQWKELPVVVFTSHQVVSWTLSRTHRITRPSCVGIPYDS